MSPFGFWVLHVGQVRGNQSHRHQISGEAQTNDDNNANTIRKSGTPLARSQKSKWVLLLSGREGAKNWRTGVSALRASLQFGEDICPQLEVNQGDLKMSFFIVNGARKGRLLQGIQLYIPRTQKHEIFLGRQVFDQSQYHPSVMVFKVPGKIDIS